MRSSRGIVSRPMKLLLAALSVLLAASLSQAAGVNQTGVTSSELDVVASQPQTVSCAAPAALGQYDKYCEGLQAEIFLLPKQKLTPSLTNLTPNITSYVTSLSGTAAASAIALKGVNALVAAKTHSIAVRYTGVLFVDQKGLYEFSLTSPSGTRLTVNGNTVTFDEGSNSSTPTTGYTFDTAGYIPVEFVFFNENSVPSLTATWQGPSSTIFTVIEGNSIMFNCTSIQNTTNSVPATSSGLCSGLSAVYYNDWANSSYASATGVATFAVYESALNHWSTSTTPSWSGLPTTLATDFAARYHGQLWVPIAGTYSFKLYADTSARLFVGTENILNATATAANVPLSQTASYTFASAGYVPMGLNFISRKSSEAGVLRLVWKGPNSPVYGVVNPFMHPCSTFVACANTTTAGALPQEVVGTPPAGSTIESVSAIVSDSLATYVPNSNVTFTLGFPTLTAEDPNVEDVAYFVREAVANAAGVKLESVWTVPSVDSTTGEVVFPLGAYFTSLASAETFYNLVNLKPQTIFSESAGLADFYPITVSAPALGTTVASTSTVQAARSMATLDSATGEDDNIPLPPVTSPTPVSSPTANASVMATSPSPTATAAAPEPSASPETSAPEASTPLPSPSPTTAALTATPAAPAPAPVAETPVPTPTPTPTPAEVATPAAPAPAPVAADTPVATEAAVATPAAAAPAPAVATPSPTAGSVIPNIGTGISDNQSPAAAAAPAASPTASEASPMTGTTMSGTTAGVPVYGAAAPSPAPTAGTTAAAPMSAMTMSPMVYGSPATTPAGAAPGPAPAMGMTTSAGEAATTPASAPALAPATTTASAPTTTTSPSSSLPTPYTTSSNISPAFAPVSAPTASHPLPSTPPPSTPPTAPAPGAAAPSLLPPFPTPTATPSVPRALLPADALPVYAPVVVPGSYALDGIFIPGPAVAAPSNGGSYFVPYSGHTGGFRVPFPVLPTSSAPVYGASAATLFGAPTSAPFAMGPDSAPAFSSSSNAPAPYGSPVASRYAGKTYFVPYPEGVGGYMVPYPAGYGGPTSDRMLGGLSGPTAAPATPAWNPILGNGPTIVSPTDNKDLLVYYGLPTTCKAGSASCTPGPYAYYAPGGTQELTPTIEAGLLGVALGSAATAGKSGLFGAAPAPAPGSTMALTPSSFMPTATAPQAAAVTPAASTASLCACNAMDTTARSVKIEVLSTAYNSTTSDTINFNAYVTFTHPTMSLNSSQIRVFTQQPSDGSGTVTTPGVVTLLSPISQNCAFYSLKGYVTESNPFIVNSTDIYLAAGGDILDACGQPFNVTVTQVQQVHRLEGLLYATGVAYSEEAGVLLDSNELDLALAFTDSVPLLKADMFTVAGPPNMTTTELESVDGSDAYYTFSVTVPESYYGAITVSMDQAGQNYLTSINSAAVVPTALTISRADPTQQGDLVNSTTTKTGHRL